jgi:hypothetical protein
MQHIRVHHWRQGQGSRRGRHDKVGIEAGLIAHRRDYDVWTLQRNHRGSHELEQGKSSGTRDVKGACRYLDFGALPIPEEAKEFHRQKVAERKEVEGELDFRMFVDDFWSLSKGKIKSKSIFG